MIDTYSFCSPNVTGFYQVLTRQMEKHKNICNILLVFTPCSYRGWKVNEKWILLPLFFENPKRKTSWVDPGAPSTSTVKWNRFGRKTMLYVLWDQRGVVYYELLNSSEFNVFFRSEILISPDVYKRGYFYDPSPQVSNSNHHTTTRSMRVWWCRREHRRKIVCQLLRLIQCLNSANSFHVRHLLSPSSRTASWMERRRPTRAK